MRAVQSVLALAAAALLGIASTSAQTPASPPLPTKVFASSQDVAALIDKAQRDRKPGQAAVLEPMLSVAPYRENLEYRAAVGPAAVHVHEDEFFYVIEGSGTFVTGGQLAHPVQTNPENLTGDAIVGGTAVSVKKGDFFVVPENTPHWFSHINGRIIDMSLHVPGSRAPQAAGAQRASQGVRIAGTVESATADTLVLATARGNVDLRMTPQTRVLLSQPAGTADIKPGAYLGTSNQNASAPDTGTATEIHLANNGPNVNFPMNQSGLTMTNGHVTSVTHTAKGEEMDIDYGQATKRHVVVPAATRITRMTDVGVAGLKPHVSVTAMTVTGTDGKPVATFIMVGPPPAAK